LAVIICVAVIKTVEGKGKELEREFSKLAPKVRKDPGAVTYVLHRHIKNQNQFLVFEKYESDEALKYHSSTPHYKEFFKNVGPIMAGIEVNFYQEVA
jgi:quinol monooxygenase YgiN